MKYRARYLVTAKQDRETIKLYLNQYSLTAANRLFDRIKSRVELAKENPYAYPAYGRRPQFRKIVVGDYLVFYKVNEDEKTIEVHHILHGMMDIVQYL